MQVSPLVGQLLPEPSHVLYLLGLPLMLPADVVSGDAPPLLDGRHVAALQILPDVVSHHQTAMCLVLLPVDLGCLQSVLFLVEQTAVVAVLFLVLEFPALYLPRSTCWAWLCRTCRLLC